MYQQYNMNMHSNHSLMPYSNNAQMPMHEGAMDGAEYQNNMYHFCKEHQYHYVMMETNDGNMYDGIIIHVETDRVYILMPVGEQRHEDLDHNGENMQFRYGGGFGSPYGGVGGFHGGFGGFSSRFRRFRRFSYPFSEIRRFFFPPFY